MFPRSASQRARNQKFEAWQQATATVLHRPGVRRQLGPLGEQLIELNANAFSLTVNDSEVRVPKRYLPTGRVGVLACLASDNNNLRAHDTFLQPTPNRRRHIQGRLGQAGVDAFIQQGIARMPAEERAVRVESGRAAHGGALSYFDEDSGTLVTGRPFVVVDEAQLPKQQILRGAIGAHELVHAIDAEELVDEPNSFYHARTEFRGRRVDAVIAEDAIRTGELSRELFEREADITLQVEEIREAHGINPDTLLNGDFQFDDDTGMAVFHMMFMGIVQL